MTGLKMKRYNCKHGPVDMIEEADGYWVTYEDYNRSTLDNNKLVEKSWRARDTQALINEEKVEKLQNTIVGLSIGLFAAVVTLLFIWMRN
jgi:hypothetical protein